jgi:DNA-directed RNA polymerase sigma subunit (sigma70/sigma32)
MTHDEFDIEYPIDIKARYMNDTKKYMFLVNLPKELENMLVEQARGGSRDAKETLILSGLAYVVRVAYTYFMTLPTHHDDFLDLIAIGNLALVEMIDTALTKQRPLIYLLTCAKLAIHHHCFYHSDLITRARNAERKTVRSLDVLLSSNFDLPAPEESSAEGGTNSVLYGALYEAIGELTQRQREAVERHHGLFGQPEEAFTDIHPGLEVAANRYRQALRRLRKKLAGLM